MGRVKQAIKLLEQVVKIQERTLAEDHLYRLVAQYELALTY